MMRLASMTPFSASIAAYGTDRKRSNSFTSYWLMNSRISIASSQSSSLSLDSRAELS